MGKVNTTKLDNGMIGFEIVYGGAEAPFGGIDASKAPRYIEPNCFADASNFLLDDNELSICSLQDIGFPPNPGVSYPLGIADPGVLLGVGKLPCESTVKNWVLYSSSGPDGSNLLHYRLQLWQNDVAPYPFVETYDFALPVTTILTPAKNAIATITVDWSVGVTAIPSVPAYAVIPPIGPPTPVVPATYDSKFWEFSYENATVGGIPTGGTPYGTLINFATKAAPFGANKTPVSGPVPDASVGPDDIAIVLMNAINASGLPFVAAITSGIPNQITLTATTIPGSASVDGTIGNLLTISPFAFQEGFGLYHPAAGTFFDSSYFDSGSNPSPFATPSFRYTIQPFSGGTDAGGIKYQTQKIQQLTYETIGDNLFLAGFPAGYMLWFDNSTSQFNVLTEYQGARVLRKMGGHLISVGLINGTGTLATGGVDEEWLWFSWSAPGAFGVWQAESSPGIVTGAGGEQLADISDLLTGLVVSNSVAFMLRAEGLSYATVLQGSAVPFDVNHVSLAKDAQGCPSTSLWTQFDQLGFYVGNTNVFMLAQSPEAVGDKIVRMLFPRLIHMANRLTDPPAPFAFTGPGDPPPPFADAFYQKVNTEPLTLPLNNAMLTAFAINAGGIIFLYDPQIGSWMKLNTSPDLPIEDATHRWAILKCVSLPHNNVTGFDGSYQNKEAYIYGQQLASGVYQPPVLKQIAPYISTTQSAFVRFPAEELMLGRDITIDSLYVLVSGVPGAVINFTIDGWQGDPSTYIQGVFSGSITLDENATPNTYEEYQVFNSDGTAVTLKAPQLLMEVPPQIPGSIGGGIFEPFVPLVPYPINSSAYYKVSKISMFGSFDPAQRPV